MKFLCMQTKAVYFTSGHVECDEFRSHPIIRIFGNPVMWAWSFCECEIS